MKKIYTYWTSKEIIYEKCLIFTVLLYNLIYDFFPKDCRFIFLVIFMFICIYMFGFLSMFQLQIEINYSA